MEKNKFKEMKQIIGAHVSTAGGVEKAVERAAAIGCNGMQIFTGSPRVWKSKAASEYEVFGLETAKAKLGVEYVVIHATYLVNLASDNPELVRKSREVLVNDLAICAKGSMAGVVVHLGSHLGRGYEAVREQLIREIRTILDGSPKESVFLIENSAGQNGKIGSDLEEIRDLLDGVDSDRLGWCFDTCHGFAAGYGLSEKSKAKNIKQIRNLKLQVQKDLFEEDKEEEVKLAVEEIERLGLWDELKCVHVNGSRDPFGSGRDRHANLGEGEISDQEMTEFLKDKRVRGLPLVLEVPGFDNKGPDRKNVERLQKLVG